MCFGQPPPSPPFFCPSPLTNALSAYPLSFLRSRTKTGTVQHLLPPSPKRASPTPAGLCGRHWSHTFAFSQHAFQKKKKLSGSSQSRLICASVCSLRFCAFQLSQVRRPNVGHSRKWTLEWWSLKPEERRLIHVYLIKRTHEKSWLRNITAEEIEGCFCR